MNAMGELELMNPPNEALKKRLLEDASYRSGWCAQEAASFGEGASRAKHLDRLRNK